MALSDIGVYNRSIKALTGSSYDRRPDGVWIDRATGKTKVIAEVESSDIISKAKNLVRFSEHITTQNKSKMTLSILIWWGSWNEDHWTKAKAVFSKGFTENSQQYWPPTEPIMIMQAKFKEVEGFYSFDRALVVDYIHKGISMTHAKNQLQTFLP